MKLRMHNCLKHVSLNILLQFVYISDHYSFMYLPHNTKIHVLPSHDRSYSPPPSSLSIRMVSLWQKHSNQCTSSLKLVPVTEEGMLVSPKTVMESPTPPAQDYSQSQVRKKVFGKGCSKFLPHPTVNWQIHMHILTIVNILVYIREHEPVSSTCD